MILNLTDYTITNDTEIEIEYGGIIYFLNLITEYLPYSILAVSGTVIGIIGNILIMGAVITTKELHSATNMLVFNLSLADMLISSLVESFEVIGVFLGKRYFDQRPILCHFIAAICLVSCETSLMNIGFLAINRYVHICHHTFYNKMFTIKKTIVYCIITWFIGLSIDVPNLAGWGGHYYDLKTLNCVWNRLASFSYSLFFPLSSIVVPCICIAACYFRIFIFVKSSKSKVTPTGINENKKSSSELKKSIRLAKGLFASFMLFTLCWLPYGLVVMTDYKDRLPRTAHMFTMAIAHFNSALNPVLYAIFNPAFQKGYKNVLSILFLGKKFDFNENKTQVSKVLDTNETQTKQI